MFYPDYGSMGMGGKKMHFEHSIISVIYVLVLQYVPTTGRNAVFVRCSKCHHHRLKTVKKIEETSSKILQFIPT